MEKYVKAQSNTDCCNISNHNHTGNQVHKNDKVQNSASHTNCTDCQSHNHNEHSGCSCGIMDNISLVAPQEQHESKNIIERMKSDKSKLYFVILGAIIFLGTIAWYYINGGNSYTIPMILLLVLSYIILGGEIVFNAVRNISKGEIFDENFLMSIATLGAFAIGEYPEAIGVMLFFRIGEMFEKFAVMQSKKRIMETVDMRPENVNLVTEDNQTQSIPANKAKVGDIILIRPGDRIPLDGVIVKGESRIDTSPVTGEHIPVTAKVQTNLISGCINKNSAIYMKVERPLSESMVTKILHSVENAAANKPKIDNFIKRFAKVYTPIVVAIAAFITLVMPLLTGDGFYPWLYTALSFLVMSCPCALVISVPLAYFCGIGAGSKRGILFKGGVVLEVLASIKSVVMDKTGTITKGNFTVQKVENTSWFTKEELLRLCAESEMLSTHPIAVSIVESAKSQNMILNQPEQIQEISGKGIVAEIDNKTVLCGNTKLMQKFKIDISGHIEDKSGTEVLVAVNNKFAGSIIISDTIKDDSRDAIKSLKKNNIATVMLTGDTESTAIQVANEVGIEEVYAKLLPDQKYNKIRDIRKKYGSVMFVGDGINDAPVLAGADVGAAMGSGADAAIEAADVVFMNSNLSAIPIAFKIAKNTAKIAKQNVIFALAIKIAVIILGVTGIYSNMWLAVFADTGVAFLCILNSMRLLYTRNETPIK